MQEVVIKKPRRGRPPSKSTSSAQTAPPALPEGPAAPKRRGRPAKSLGETLSLSAIPTAYCAFRVSVEMLKDAS